MAQEKGLIGRFISLLKDSLENILYENSEENTTQETRHNEQTDENYTAKLDENGREISRTYYKEDGSIDEIVNLEYDENGANISRSYVDSDGNLKGIGYFNPEDNNVQKIVEYENGNVKKTREHNGNICKEYDSNGKLTTTYDFKNKIVTDYLPNGKQKITDVNAGTSMTVIPAAVTSSKVTIVQDGKQYTMELDPNKDEYSQMEELQKKIANGEIEPEESSDDARKGEQHRRHFGF